MLFGRDCSLLWSLPYIRGAATSDYWVAVQAILRRCKQDRFSLERITLSWIEIQLAKFLCVAGQIRSTHTTCRRQILINRPSRWLMRPGNRWRHAYLHLPVHCTTDHSGLPHALEMSDVSSWTYCLKKVYKPHLYLVLLTPVLLPVIGADGKRDSSSPVVLVWTFAGPDDTFIW